MKGITKILLICTITTCISLNGSLTFGQGKSEMPPRHRWDISTDLLWLINKNNLPPSVFVRWNRKNHKRLYAYRLRLGGNYYHNTHSDPLTAVGGFFTQTTSLKFYLSLGKEWQKWLNDKFQFFYGNDLIYDYQRTRLKNTVVDSNTDDPRTYPIINEFTLGTSVFAGIKFFLTERISFSSETHISIKYYHHKLNSLFLDPVKYYAEENSYLLIDYNQPIQVINLTYHL